MGCYVKVNRRSSHSTECHYLRLSWEAESRQVIRTMKLAEEGSLAKKVPQKFRKAI